MPYSESFKRKMVQRMTGPNATSSSALAREVNIHQTTLSQWLRQAPVIIADLSSSLEQGDYVMKQSPKRPEDLCPEDKMAAVLEASALSDDHLGAFPRRK